MIPIVLCIDVEPDLRVPARPGVPRLEGFEALVERLPALRRRLSDAGGAPATFAFALRLDPQMADLYGSPAWLADTYASVLHDLQATGDEVGLHIHMARWDSGWISDHADPSWVAHCTATALDTFAATFGRPCRFVRFGDRFFTDALFAQLAAAGVVADVTIEPGLPSVPRLAIDERGTGAIPASTDSPTFAFHPSPGAPLVPDPKRGDGLVALPLTPGVTVSVDRSRTPAVAAGTYETLVPWMDPGRFTMLLKRRLGAPELTHLAFAVRSDVGARPRAWAPVERNLASVADAVRPLGGAARWTGPEQAAAVVDLGRHAAAALAPDCRWRLGTRDPGHREGVGAVASALLDGDAGAIDPAVDLSAAAPPAGALRWRTGARTVECVGCGAPRPAERVAEVRARDGVLEASRCSTCGTVAIETPAGSQRPGPPSEALCDRYIEYFGSVEAAALLLARAGRRPWARVVDIGCGYGFGLDLARFLYGWSGTGFDPSPLGQRGAADLGIDIRPARFEEAGLAPGTVDVVIASEVIEHLDDPRRFLGLVRRCLVDDGVLVLSTPDGDAVTPGRPTGPARAALGMGEHRFLYSKGALEAHLADAGFARIDVTAGGGSLVATAAPTSVGDAAVDDHVEATLDLETLASYCAHRRDRAAEGSALHAGMAARAARVLLAAGDVEGAAAAVPPLRDAILARHGLDLDRPPETTRAAAEGLVAPLIADAHFTCGLVALIGGGDAGQAAEHFAAAAAVADGHIAVERDLSLPALVVRGRAHEAVAVARARPDETPAAVGRLLAAAEHHAGVTDVDVDTMTARVFTELVAGGHYGPARDVRPDVCALRRALPVGDDDARRAALDAHFCDAMLCFQAGDWAAAESGFQRCHAEARAVGSDHALHLAAVASDHAALARARSIEVLA